MGGISFGIDHDKADIVDVKIKTLANMQYAEDILRGEEADLLMSLKLDQKDKIAAAEAKIGEIRKQLKENLELQAQLQEQLQSSPTQHNATPPASLQSSGNDKKGRLSSLWSKIKR